jgi:hypothetical protein
VTSGGLARSPGGTRSKGTYKRKRKGKRSLASSRTAAYYHKRGESRVTGQPATGMGWGRQLGKMLERERRPVSKGGEEDQFHE